MFDTPQTERPLWGPMASLALHTSLVALLAWAGLKPVAPAIPPESISVEMISPATLARMLAPPVLRASAPDPIPTEPERASENDAMIEATQFQAAGILRESRQVREALPLLAPEERMTQLCNIEAIEQINAWNTDFTADTLVAYAFADVTAAGLTLNVADGAFRSHRAWYHIALDCTVAADFSAVTAFRFKVGGPVPPEDWEAHDLTAAEIE